MLDDQAIKLIAKESANVEAWKRTLAHSSALRPEWIIFLSGCRIDGGGKRMMRTFLGWEKYRKH